MLKTYLDHQRVQRACPKVEPRFENAIGSKDCKYYVTKAIFSTTHYMLFNCPGVS